MTKIAEIKQVMRSDREKVNNICKYELEPNISREESRTRNCDMTSKRKNKNTYGTTAATETLDLGSMSSVSMSSRRLSTSGKKSSSGK